jgi:hypothetical protein
MNERLPAILSLIHNPMTQRLFKNQKVFKLILFLLVWTQFLVAIPYRALAYQIAGAADQLSRPSDVPAGWRGLIGEYVLGRDTISVLEKDGMLYWAKNSGRPSRLVAEGADRFGSATSMPNGNKVWVFHRNPAGFATSLDCAPSVFKRVF